MLLIFVLAVALIPNYVPISLALPCERSCACYEGAYIAACADRGLFSVPRSFSPTVMQIDLQDNKITQLPRAAFKGISNSSKPSRLNMSNNGLLFIEDHALETLTNLFTLDLSRNNLSLVTDYSFRGLRRLRYLYLQNNMIKSVSENAFLGIINIRRLNFSGNRLTEVPWPGSADVLEKFDVSRNLIQTSPAIPNVETASSLDIWFGENPWGCDCELTHFLKSLETAGDNIHVRDRDKMACAGPENLKGETLDVLVAGIKGIVSTCCPTNGSESPVCKSGETSEMFKRFSVANVTTKPVSSVSTMTVQSESSHNRTLTPSNPTTVWRFTTTTKKSTTGRNDVNNKPLRQTTEVVILLDSNPISDSNPSHKDIFTLVEISVYFALTVGSFVGILYFALKLAWSKMCVK
ncbi:PREDICTED: leucine-rich repeat and fibronectin type-III domain-containing protein 5-like [Branchiostoma belcheri]|uniref:Leucine-rich repeat and fibronectin type-III domain-containing protein 5-like n=1 Tax=Branchiostoma belcheri TaxID=7741 RepID=A0A6P4XKK6_BRABE|nr:PREDICTED: leucine-rich repeat and fibronectin type-III domain-containing protein 5-like [Branchiostoma belcheri]